MNLKKVLSTSVASLTVLSTLSGSVSTKIYASSTEGEMSIPSENDANKKSIYCVTIMDGENISSIRFVYNLGVGKEFIVKVACDSDELSPESAKALADILNGDVGKALRGNNSRITREQLEDKEINLDPFYFTDEDVAKINGEATLEGKVEKITAVLSGETNAKAFEHYKSRGLNLDNAILNNNTMQEHQTADDKNPAEGNVEQQQHADEKAAGDKEQKENDVAEIKQEQGQEQNKVAEVTIKDETQSDEETKKDEEIPQELKKDEEPKEDEPGKKQNQGVYAKIEKDNNGTSILNFFCNIEGYKFEISISDYCRFSSSFKNNTKEIKKLAKIINNPMVGKGLQDGICKYDVDNYLYTHLCVCLNDEIIKEICKEAKDLGIEDTQDNQAKASKVREAIIGAITRTENYKRKVPEIESRARAMLNFQSVDETKKGQTPDTYVKMEPAYEGCKTRGKLKFFYDIKGYKFLIYVPYSTEYDTENLKNQEEIYKLAKIINNPIVGKKLRGGICKYSTNYPKENYVKFNGSIIKKICKAAKGLGSTKAKYEDSQEEIALNVCNAIIKVIKESGDYQKESQKLEGYTPILYPKSDDQSKEGETQEKQTSGVINNESQGNSTGTESTNIIQTTVETKKEAGEGIKNGEPAVINSADETTDSSQTLSTNSTELDQQQEISKSTQTTENSNLNSETQTNQPNTTGPIIDISTPTATITEVIENNTRREKTQNDKGSENDNELEGDESKSKKIEKEQSPVGGGNSTPAVQTLDQTTNKVTEGNKELTQTTINKTQNKTVEKDEKNSENSFSTQESKTPGLFRRIWNNIKKFLSRLPLIGKFFK